MQGINTIQTINKEIHLTIDTGIIPTIGIEITQIGEINGIKTIYQEIIQTIDQIIKDLTTTVIKIDHEITHKIETQTITLDKKHYHQSPHRNNTRSFDSKSNIEVMHQNIKDK